MWSWLHSSWVSRGECEVEGRIGTWRKREWAPWLRGNALRCVHSSGAAGRVRWSSDCPGIDSAPATHCESRYRLRYRRRFRRRIRFRFRLRIRFRLRLRFRYRPLATALASTSASATARPCAAPQ